MNEIHTIHYPPVNKIIEVSGIRLAMDKAWTKINENATKSGRCEYGFFIYAENDGSIHAGDMVKGDEVWYCEDSFATINLGIPVSNITVCAFFHCHST